MYQQYQLENGATIILVPQADAKSTTTLVMYPVGSRHETEPLSGVSHYVEHLMFKGTKKRPTTLALTKEIDRLGAEYNAFTGKEYTGYYIKTSGEYTDIAMDILSDMLFHSTFDPEEMEREKTVIVEEIKMYNDNPLMNIDNIFEEIMFDGCALGRDIAGTAKHVLSYKRDEVIAYKDTYYHPKHMTVVVAGAITPETKTIVEKHFGQERTTEPGNPDTFEPAAFGQGESRIKVQQKQTDQIQLMLGWPGFSYNDTRENIITSVLSTILGGSMSSRLFIQIRERRGLAYMIRSGVDQYRDTGYFYIRAGLDVAKLNDAIAVMKEECQKVIDNGVTEEELRDAKTHLRGGLTLSMEDSSAQANWYARQSLFMDTITTPEEKLAMVDTVTLEDIQSFAKKIFDNSNMRVGIIGNVKAEDVVF